METEILLLEVVYESVEMSKDLMKAEEESQIISKTFSCPILRIYFNVDK